MANQKNIPAAEILSELFSQVYGQKPDTIILLPGAGSDRKYWRLRTADRSVIGVWGPDREENLSFIRLSRYFKSKGIPVGDILGISDDQHCYLTSDLGDNSLYSKLSAPDVKVMVEESVRTLAHIQTLPYEEWRELVRVDKFGSRQVAWDLNYFKYEMLKPAGILFSESRLEDDFERLIRDISNEGKDYYGFMYRDFQSRNVMWMDEAPWLIDYQGGMYGPLVYDIVSFLWQAKAKFTPDFRAGMLEVYFDELGKYLPAATVEKIRKRVPLYVFFRLLQVLGAYGFRGLVERKAHFLESIRPAPSNLKDILRQHDFSKVYPTLSQACQDLIKSPKFQSSPHDGLKAEVFSFSYKKGYPDDYSGNGGGFMFDCRGMENPGRYKEYKPLTGMDREVIEFLESKGEVQIFLSHCIPLVESSLKEYLRRGFSNIQIGFGCTGGQHRSVYCANKMARYIREHFPEIEVSLRHREHPELNNI